MLHFFLRIFDVFFSEFRAEFQKRMTSVAFESNFRKQIRKLPKILKAVKLFNIVQYYSFVSLHSIRNLGCTAFGPGATSDEVSRLRQENVRKHTLAAVQPAALLVTRGSWVPGARPQRAQTSGLFIPKIWRIAEVGMHDERDHVERFTIPLSRLELFHRYSREQVKPPLWPAGGRRRRRRGGP